MEAGAHARAEARATAVAAAMDDVKRIEASGPLDRERIAQFRARLLELLTERDLFAPEDFPPPADGGACLYRIAQDDDGRFALYVNACKDSTKSPVHNHTTWAVVCGFDGQELNRFYRRDDDGRPEFTHEEMVEAGAGVAMLPDDLHSIHIDGGGLNFHMYGRALDQLEAREYFSERDGAWKRMAAFRTIIEARPGVAVAS